MITQFIIKRKKDYKYLNHTGPYDETTSWTYDINLASHYDEKQCNAIVKWLLFWYIKDELEVSPLALIEQSELDALRKNFEDRCKLVEQLEDDLARKESII